MASLIFKDAEAAKAAIMASQQKEIAKLYEDWADEIGERAKYYSHKSTASAPVSERYYRELQKQLRQTSQEVSNEIYKKIKSNIYTVADAVVSDNVKWLESFGFSSDGLNAAFSYVPHEIVQNLVTGQIYDSGWSLSSRIWGDNEQTLKDIYQVMAKGLAENKPIYEIAKDLESYVRPSAKLPWNLRMADGKKIYKKQVDYNAQRLARTLVQHGYQQSFIATTQKNPFITEYIWRSNGSRVCDLCKARDGVHYKKTELPMDHPNGMCTMEPVVADDMIDQLADWFNSPDGTYPEIDEFASSFGYDASKKSTNSNANAEHKVVNGKNIIDSWKRRADKFDFEIEDVINAQGFDGLPQVVSADEFDKYVKESNFIAQRIYSAQSKAILDEYQNQLYNGKWYVDCSTGGAAYGQGMYCAANYKGILTDGIVKEMRDYEVQNLKVLNVGSISRIETFTLSKDSKIISYEKLRDLAAKDFAKSKLSNATSLSFYDEDLEKSITITISDSNRSAIEQITNLAYKLYNSNGKLFDQRREFSDQIQKIAEAYHSDKSVQRFSKFYTEFLDLDNSPNVSVSAVTRGYDAIQTDSGTSGADTVILNRTKVIIRGE